MNIEHRTDAPHSTEMRPCGKVNRPMSTYTTQTDSSIDYDHDDFADEHDDFKRTAYPFLVFDERGAYDQLTGSSYRRCIECEAEVPTGRSRFYHKPDCPVPDDTRDVGPEWIDHRERSIHMDTKTTEVKSDE